MMFKKWEPCFLLRKSVPGLPGNNTGKGKKAEMQQCSVHFTIAQAIYLSLTPVNQIVNFCKYSKNAKQTFRANTSAETKGMAARYRTFRPNL